MKKIVIASFLALLPAVAIAADAPPDWAFPAAPPGYQPPPETDQPKHVAGSTKAYTAKQIGDIHSPPDWFPNEHPAQPDIVMHGKDGVNACSQCHLATGYGHPESANLSGLPAGYIEEQLGEFKNGNRRSSLPGRSNNMIAFSKGLSDAEVKAAAAYFSSNKPVQWTKVVETATVPKSYVGEGNMRFAVTGNDKEPIGRRIIEVPEEEEGAKARDPHSPFIAYVPVGSIKAGEALVTTGGNGKTIQCTICHGPDLKGLGNVPGLAGRSAIYVFRQLYDIQHGTRTGNPVALMKPVVEKLSQDDMIALAAYMASRTP